MPPIRSLSGIRGLVGETMTSLEAYKTTFAFYKKYLIPTPFKSLKIIVGKDAKKSGDNLVRGVKLALEDIAKKENVRFEMIYLGITSSPIIQWAVKNYKAQGGINITASHNDIKWNGFKLINKEGFLLNKKEMSKVNVYLNKLEKGCLPHIPSEETFLKQPIRKSAQAKEIFQKYNQDVISKVKKVINYCAGKKIGEDIFKKLKKYKVIIDACSKEGAQIPEQFLLTLGLKRENIIIINGNSIENSTRRLEPAPEYLGNLRKAIRENKADLGFALDPDQDRLVCMPLKSEEHTVLLAGKFLLALQMNNPQKYITKIPVNLSTSNAWEDLGKQYHIKIIRTPVGEINVIEAMLKNKAPLGGEGNGGIILGEINYGRNSSVGIALLLSYLAWQKKKLKVLESKLPPYFLLKEKMEIPLNKNPQEIVEKVAKKFISSKTTSLDKRDGSKIFFKDNSWIQFRFSNTEPIMRIFAEVKIEKGRMKKAKEEVKKLVEKGKYFVERSL